MNDTLTGTTFTDGLTFRKDFILNSLQEITPELISKVKEEQGFTDEDIAKQTGMGRGSVTRHRNGSNISEESKVSYAYFLSQTYNLQTSDEIATVISRYVRSKISSPVESMIKEVLTLYEKSYTTDPVMYRALRTSLVEVLSALNTIKVDEEDRYDTSKAESVMEVVRRVLHG